ncbi:NAD(P)-binding protein [Wallemia mellicola CBS 633.66]|uniref:NAD(P)-binding protein n=1 Tax=Wallemia mellicola (strain ATCC MYA-4683 / CBS 633.66) TaxID=671144 RepID=I4YII4_WALMC|nr:NAD(P)-binding protein [Wallemia mellicola CBS 633.66]EIM23776.1 NAD(P)-binding protein [Wallemia mellicola CBS 633.66]|eukprot:XP_006956439.1 NAD(P)-binding protein [Wallemia mellicola CBS 633.66]
MSTSNQPLRFGVLGIGRMGIRHALNVVNEPRAQLVAVADPRKDVLEASKEILGENVKRFISEEDVINDPSIQAILVASDTTQHPILALKAIKAGKHLLLEKPIAVNLDDAAPVVAEAKRNPHLKILVGMSRRFDDSYREAFNRIQSGELGDVFHYYGVTNDQYNAEIVDFFVGYSKVSGSILVDCGIHDVDLMRWYMGPNEKVKKVYAAGYNARMHRLKESRDADNSVATIVFESGKLANIYLSRTAIHGHECWAQITGENGMIKVNTDNAMNRVTLADEHGYRKLTTQDYYDRFRGAFANEMREFTSAVLDNTPLPLNIDDAFEASKICVGLQMAFRSDEQIFFDKNGYPIPPKGIAPSRL